MANDLLSEAGDTLPRADILPLLEALTQHPEGSGKALGLLTDFYQTTFCQSRNWPTDHSQPTLHLLPQSQSEYLSRLLSQTSPVIEWSCIPTGKPASIERMALGEPPFPKSGFAPIGYKPAIVHLQGPWLKRLESLLHDTPEPVKRRLFFLSGEQPLAAIISGFLQWLGAHDTHEEREWYWLVSRRVNFFEGGKDIDIAAGYYKTPPPPSVIGPLLQDANRGVELNSTRLESVPEMSGAKGIFLTQEYMDCLSSPKLIFP